MRCISAPWPSRCRQRREAATMTDNALIRSISRDSQVAGTPSIAAPGALYAVDFSTPNPKSRNRSFSRPSGVRLRCVGRRLTKAEEEESIIINRPDKSTYPEQKSVSRSGATPVQSFSVSSSGDVKFIQQYTVGVGPCCAMVSIAAGGGYLFYSDFGPEVGSVTSVQISAGNMAAGFEEDAPSWLTGSLFFDAPASTLLSNMEFRSYGAFVIPLASPNNANSVVTDSNSAGLAVVGN